MGRWGTCLMKFKLAKFLYHASPMDPFILLYSMIVGALSGAVFGILVGDPEYASTVGIAVCIQVGVGLWLGQKLFSRNL